VIFTDYQRERGVRCVRGERGDDTFDVLGIANRHISRDASREAGPMRLRKLVTASLLAAVLMMVMVLPAFAQQSDCGGKHQPACQVPEVPIAAFLPVAAIGIVGGYLLIQRHRSRRNAAASSESPQG
jgi:hypothetical protein